jgi:hypothetical protein
MLEIRQQGSEMHTIYITLIYARKIFILTILRAAAPKELFKSASRFNFISIPMPIIIR